MLSALWNGDNIGLDSKQALDKGDTFIIIGTHFITVVFNLFWFLRLINE
jgi:hypothetical protein